jgi:hypothetical protein
MLILCGPACYARQWADIVPEACRQREAMRRRDFLALCYSLCGRPTFAQTSPFSGALAYLQKRMDAGHERFYVFQGLNSAYNHFFVRSRITPPGGDDSVPVMDESRREDGMSGATCIRCQFHPGIAPWGGWLLANGVLGPGQTSPVMNWGEFPMAGVDLTGATKLSFRAKSLRGTPTVEFYCFGTGRQPGQFQANYPDSAAKLSLQTTLQTDWVTYTLDLGAADTSYVIAGFGWSATAVGADGEVDFLIDSIQYALSRLNQPRFIVSYEIDTPPLVPDPNTVQRLASEARRRLINTAYVYDNSLALLAFLAAGDAVRADLMATALSYTVAHDPAVSGNRIRNSYQGGDLSLPPGWQPLGAVRLPAYFNTDTGATEQDHYDVSTSTGVAAWAALALLSHFEITGNQQSLQNARRLADWIIANCAVPGVGFTAGYEGWPGSGPNPAEEATCPNRPLVGGQCKRSYMATEHNADVYPLYRRLYHLTGEPLYADGAAWARRFLESMWREDADGARFLTGTDDSGAPAGPGGVIPVDIQAWCGMALRGDAGRYAGALTYVEAHHTVDGGGYCFQQRERNRFGDIPWYEGTAHVANAYRLLGNTDKWATISMFLAQAQLSSGGMYAASADGMDTGFNLYSADPNTAGDPWLYFRMVHAGATAWLALVASPDPVNPYWLGAPADLV